MNNRYLAIKYKVKRKKDQFMDSKLLLGTICLIIGISWTYNYIEFKSLMADHAKALQAYERVIENRSHSAVLNSEEKSDDDGASESVQSTSQEEVTRETPLEGRIITVTSYNAEVAQTDADPFTMASGKRVYEGAIATNCYPIGTKLELEGLGTFTVEDRINQRFTQDCGTENERADIFKWNKEDNGKWNVKLTVLS